MIEVQVYDAEGKEKEKISFDETVFGDKVTQMQGGEQEISCLQLAAILGPFVLLLMGLIPIVGAFAN